MFCFIFIIILHFSLFFSFFTKSKNKLKKNKFHVKMNNEIKWDSILLNNNIKEKLTNLPLQNDNQISNLFGEETIYKLVQSSSNINKKKQNSTTKAPLKNPKTQNLYFNATVNHSSIHQFCYTRKSPFELQNKTNNNKTSIDPLSFSICAPSFNFSTFFPLQKLPSEYNINNNSKFNNNINNINNNLFNEIDLFKDEFPNINVARKRKRNEEEEVSNKEEKQNNNNNDDEELSPVLLNSFLSLRSKFQSQNIELNKINNNNNNKNNINSENDCEELTTEIFLQFINLNEEKWNYLWENNYLFEQATNIDFNFAYQLLLHSKSSGLADLYLKKLIFHFVKSLLQKDWKIISMINENKLLNTKKNRELNNKLKIEINPEITGSFTDILKLSVKFSAFFHLQNEEEFNDYLNHLRCKLNALSSPPKILQIVDDLLIFAYYN